MDLMIARSRWAAWRLPSHFAGGLTSGLVAGFSWCLTESPAGSDGLVAAAVDDDMGRKLLYRDPSSFTDASRRHKQTRNTGAAESRRLGLLRRTPKEQRLIEPRVQMQRESFVFQTLVIA
jgi:hypothetical protein